MKIKELHVIFILIVTIAACKTEEHAIVDYRPKIHFTPQAHWMNDPNGMVFYKGTYHLFYQYYPDSTVWGPMHWGHASTKDLIHWEHLPIALYPDSLGYIFSGSAVADLKNTSGFGKNGIVPLVAIYTNHDPKGEKEKSTTYQNQSLAYSLDEGKKWIKFAGNPVLKSPDITDFRDPKVMWYERGHTWIMTLATKDRITFYSSTNLKTWTKQSEFGEKIGGHGGVWECPDLFPLTKGGKTYWVLLVSINPGAPNGGSGTQYFVGDFDGKVFKPLTTKTRWIDYGTDNYAGVTWSNTGNRRIFLGWMSNWLYANQVPTKEWRGATTVPREFSLANNSQEIILVTQPIKELDKIDCESESKENIKITALQEVFSGKNVPFKVELQAAKLESFVLYLRNKLGEQILIGYDKKSNQYFMDRTKSGNTSFNPEFSKVHYAPRVSSTDNLKLKLIVDVTSVELFADDGMTAMTDILFPNAKMDRISISSGKGLNLSKMKFTELQVIR